MTALDLAVMLDEADCARRLMLHNPNLTAVGVEASFVLCKYQQFCMCQPIGNKLICVA